MGVVLMVILTILKVIGWILLSVVGLTILILLILLLTPFTYSLEAEKKPDTAWATVRAGWLFNLVRYRLVWREWKRIWALKVGWRTVSSEPPIERKPKRKRRTKKDGTPRVEEAPASIEKPAEEKPEEPGESRQKERRMDPEPEKQPKSGWKQRFQAWRNKLLGFREKLDTIKQEIENYPEKMETFVVLRGFVGKLLRTLLPRKLRIHVHFGLGDPAATGYVLGLYYMIMPFLPVRQIDVVPNFQEKVLEGEARADGWMTMGHLLWHTFWTYRDKHTRDLIAYIRNKKK